MIARKELESMILEKYPGVYSEDGLKSLISQIEELREDLHSSLIESLANDKQPSAEVGGFSIEDVQEATGANLIAAHLNLKYLIDNPDKLELAQKEGLSRVFKVK